MAAVETKFFDYGRKEIEYLSNSDPVLGDAMARFGRVEREVIPDPFAALVNAIIGQLISVSSAKTVWSRMQESLGDITPENLSAVSADEIQRCGMIMKKAITISELSKDILQGKVCLNNLRQLPDQEIIRYLTMIKGVGLWTAEMLLINCLERPDVVSWGDIAIRRGMEKLYDFPKLTKDQFEVCKRRYSPYGSVASIYLWKISFL
jgi:DNA-3-methyladenine glycosylase II